jgi:hypothetical protein
MEKLASCYMRDQKWAEAIPVLLTMLQKSWTPEQRQAVLAAQSYIESIRARRSWSFSPTC